jgi:hypothetical protein
LETARLVGTHGEVLMDGDEEKGFEIVMYELAACERASTARGRGSDQRGGRDRAERGRRKIETPSVAALTPIEQKINSDAPVPALLGGPHSPDAEMSSRRHAWQLIQRVASTMPVPAPVQVFRTPAIF